MPVFPAHLINPSSVKRSLAGRVIASAPSLSGVTQAVRTDGGGLWQLQYSGIVLRTREQLAAWNVVDSYLAGGAQRIAVPMLTNHLAPRGLQGGRLARYGGLQVTGNPYLPDAVQYGTPLVVASAGASANRATTLTITVAQGSSLKGGEPFSIAHATKGNRGYRVVQPLGNGQFEIDPPLREAIGDATPLNFDWPLVDCIAVPQGDYMPDVQNNRGEVSISFQEAF